MNVYDVARLSIGVKGNEYSKKEIMKICNTNVGLRIEYRFDNSYQSFKFQFTITAMALRLLKEKY